LIFGIFELGQQDTRAVQNGRTSLVMDRLIANITLNYYSTASPLLLPVAS